MADRSIVVRMRAEISDFKAQMAAAATAAKQTGTAAEGAAVVASTAMGRVVQSATAHRQAWTTAGIALTAFGAAVSLALVGTVKAAIDWESAWAGVTKTVSGTPEQLAAIEAGLRGLATTLPATHAEIAAVAEAAGQLGVQTGSIVAFTKVMVDLGETTNLTADEAATSIAQLMNIMQSAPGDVDNLGAALVALGNNGASTERDIIQMSQRIAAAGAVIGLTEADVLGFANAISSLGIDVEAGGTAISRVMTDMSKAVSTGGDNLQLFAQTAGMSADDFATAFRDDPADAIATFIEGLGRIKDSGGDVFTVLSDLGMSDIRVSNALLSMANSGDLLRTSLDLGAQAWEDNTALVAEAEKRYDTTAAKIAIARNTIYDAGITIGQSLTPAVAGMAESVASIAQAFASLPAPIQRSLGIMGGLVGVTALAAGAFVTLFPRVIDIVGALKDLNLAGSGVPAMLGKVSKAALIAGGAITVMLMAGALQKEAVVTPQIADVTKALLDIADAAPGAKASLDALFAGKGGFSDWFWGNNVDSAERAFQILTDPTTADNFDNIASKILSLGTAAGSTDMLQAATSVEAMDLALTNMVTSGAADQAAASIAGYGLSTEEVTQLLPGYTEALAANTEEQGAATEAQKAAADAAALTANTYTNLVRGTAELTDAQQALIDTVRGTASAFVDPLAAYQALQEAAEGGTVSLESWIGKLEEQKVSLDNWATNLILLSGRASAGMIQNLAAMGPEGAAMVADLVNSSGDEIARLEPILGDGAQAGVDAVSNVFLTSGPVIAAASAQLGEGAALEIAQKLASGTYTVEQIIAEYGLIIEGYTPVVTVNTATEEALVNLHAVIAAADSVNSCQPNVNTSTTGNPEAIANLHAVVAAADSTNSSDPSVDVTTTGVPPARDALNSVTLGAMAIPGSRNTNVTTAGTGTAIASIAGVRNALLGIQNKTVTITAIYAKVISPLPGGAGGGLVAEGAIVRGYAGGGMIPGTPPADPMVDNVLARGPGGMFAIRSGEFVSTQLATARNYAALVAGNRGATLAAVGYAGGGYVTPTGPATAGGRWSGGGDVHNQSVNVYAVPTDHAEEVARAVLWELNRYESGGVYNERRLVNG